MIKPNGYDEVSVDYVPVALGGHTAKIMEVREQKTKAGNDMIVVSIDFDQYDAQAGYFLKAYNNDTRNPKKWDFKAVQYIAVTDNEGKTRKAFKQFITSVEKSNNMTVQWSDNFSAQFKGRKIGVVYGEEESEYNDEIRTQRRIRYFCEYSKATEQEVPEKRFLNGGSAPGIANVNFPIGQSNDEFMQIPDNIEDGLPFN